MKNTPTINEYPLGERVRYFRKKRNLTQTQLANLCQISQGAVAQIEKSQTLPSLDTLKKIASVLRVQIALFFATDDTIVLDIKRLKTDYPKRSDLNPTLLRALNKINDYIKTLK